MDFARCGQAGMNKILTIIREERRMKKKVVAILLCSLVAGLAGCGGKTETVDTGKETTAEMTETEETKSEENKGSISTDTLAGVYPDADELTSVSMGGCINGEQVDLVNVEMPLNYIFGAGYVDADQNSGSFENARGNGTLSTALELNFQNQPYVINEAETVASGESGTSVRYIVVTDETFEDVKQYAQAGSDFSNYTEKTINGNEIVYFVDNSQYAQEDLILEYNINNDAYLCVLYKGTLADKLGLDQLAENIAGLITVIQ